jgi:hypothetical protein
VFIFVVCFFLLLAFVVAILSEKQKTYFGHTKYATIVCRCVSSWLELFIKARAHFDWLYRPHNSSRKREIVFLICVDLDYSCIALG